MFSPVRADASERNRAACRRSIKMVAKMVIADAMGTQGQ